MAWATGVQILHAKVLAPVETWREQTFDPTAQLSRAFEEGDDGNESGSEGHESWRFQHVRSAGDMARVGLVAVSGRASNWAMLDTKEQLQEIMLFLLVWGEAAHLRFMPQIVYFVFELARAHASKHLGSVSHTADGEFHFLQRVIRPIYVQLKAEIDRNVLTSYYDFRNHDDFNEAFWSPAAMRLLRVKEGSGMLSEAAASRSSRIMDQEPGSRCTHSAIKATLPPPPPPPHPLHPIPAHSKPPTAPEPSPSLAPAPSSTFSWARDGA